ncbi:MAG: ABC transporter permease [Bryobacteraceae bacterium]
MAEASVRNLTFDLRHTLRRLARTPGFTLATILVLALGIGANTAIFSVINGVLLRPLPFPDAERLIGVWQTAPGVKIDDLNASLADYIAYREDSRTFADVAIWNGRSITVTEFRDPERVDGIQCSFRLFPMLGIHPALGRAFLEKDNVNGSPDVIMISHGYWRRRFGGDPKAVGRRVLVDGSPREIIGVLPPRTWFMDRTHDIVLPIRFDRNAVRLAGYNFQGIARLKPGVSIAQANADVRRMIDLELEKFPPPPGMTIQMMKDARLGPKVRPLKDDLLGDIGNTLWVVMATVGIVLLIACANVANLLLVRTESRAQELAVRAALGAGRARIARELMLESVTLALLGGALGMGFAVAVLRLVLTLSPARLPRFDLISVDASAAAFGLAVALVAGIGLGAIPVWKQLRAGLAMGLRSGGRSSSAGRERHIARNGLTVVQVALALVLLVGSGLMIRTFLSMRRVDPGFRGVDSLQTFRLSIPRDVVKTDAERRVLWQRLYESLGGIAGVTQVGAISGLPMTNARSQDPIMAKDKTYRPDQIPPLRRFITIGPGAFAALGIPLRAGREYTWTDIHEQRKVIIVSENFAREYWGAPAAAIGKQIRTHFVEGWYEIVGVAGDVRHDGVGQPAPSTVYWAPRDFGSMSVAMRTARAGGESLSNEFRKAVWSVQGALPVTEIRTMKEIFDRSMARTSFTLVLLGISGFMALLLASVGIYAVIAYHVAQRTREIGIRLALGARQSTLRLMFVRHGLLWGGIGAAVGLAGAAVLSRLMSGLLYEVRALDPLTYLAVAAMLLAVAAAASYIPARRVSRVDPIEALRAD